MINSSAAEMSASLSALTGLNLKCLEKKSGVLVFFADVEQRESVGVQVDLKGLRRHQFSIVYGKSAGLLLQQIKSAGEAQQKLSNELAKRVFALAGVRAELDKTFADICMSGASSEIFLSRLDIDDHGSVEEWNESLRNIAAPLMVALAELIGFEDELCEAGEAEGEEYLRQSIARERSARNRQMCLTLRGAKCEVCGWDSKKVYGSAFEIIDVHHTNPLASFEGAKIFNPLTDLVPLCPNCHRAAHKKSPPFSIEELKALVKGCS